MVVAVCDVPIIWEADSWKTSMGFTLVDELWMKKDSCKRCSKNRCYLSFTVHPNNLNSCRPFVLHGPQCHWYIVDTSLVPINDEVKGNFIHFSYCFNINQEMSFHFLKVLHCNLCLSAGSALDKAHLSKEMLAPLLCQRVLPTIG